MFSNWLLINDFILSYSCFNFKETDVPHLTHTKKYALRDTPKSIEARCDIKIKKTPAVLYYEFWLNWNFF